VKSIFEKEIRVRYSAGTSDARPNGVKMHFFYSAIMQGQTARTKNNLLETSISSSGTIEGFQGEISLGREITVGFL
jgi:hypothetical protein